MKTKMTLAVAIAAAGFAVPAFAQDSVSNAPGTFEGDALDPWNTLNQRTDFVVDLTPFTTSGGASFGVAPLLKTSKSSTAFFSSLLSSQTVSATEVIANEFAQPTYSFWDFAGGGVNVSPFRGGRTNEPGTDIAPTATGDIRQFVAGFSEFATTDAAVSHNAAIAGLVQFDSDNPNRLYVSRHIVATGGSNNAENHGGVSTGTADSAGYYYFRSDNFGTVGPSPIAGNNIFRVDLLGRTANMQNSLSAAGLSDAAASERLVNASADTFSVPGNIPADVAGRPVYVGLTFNSTMAHESAAGVVTETAAHLAASDHTGTIATYSSDVLGAGGVATIGSIGRNGSGDTDNFNLSSVDANGAPVAGSPVALTIPSGTVVDAFESYTVGAALGTIGELDHYHSQVPFQGGNGGIAIGSDAQGRGLVAGVVYLTASGNQDPFNAIVVGRFDSSDPAGTVEWGIGAYIDIDTTGMDPMGVAGKPVYDDMGTAIGQLRTYNELDPVFNAGPSLSGVSFDGSGNIWFTAPVAFDDGKGGTFINSTLLRGVYQPDVNGGFGYRLEKVISFFDEFESQNTGLNYRVFGFQIVDNNSVSSGTFWSSNVKQNTFGDIDASTIDPADARSTAGVVVATSITYDVDNDGDFTLNTKDDPTTIDEAYNVLLYIAPNVETGGPECIADFDNSGVVDSGDLAVLLAAWGTMDAQANLDGSGVVDSGDLAVLLAAWGDCP